MQYLLFLTTALSIAVMTALPGQTIQESGVPNGIYLVESKHTDKPAPDAIGEATLIPFSHQFLDDNLDNQPRFLVIDTRSSVPLDISERPLRLRDAGGKSKLILSLAQESRSKLTALTTEHVGSVVAIVVNGEAVTIHKFREPIDSGKIQITRCTDNACEYLYSALK